MSGFVMSELDDYAKSMLSIAEEIMPKEAKAFLRKEGNKLKQKTLQVARTKVKEKTGYYHKSIRRGKVYTYNGALAVRTYSGAPHGHLIEDGHRIIVHGKEAGFAPGKHVFQAAGKEFNDTYARDCETFVGEVMDKL